MQVKVFDTWVEGSKGKIHFDVLVDKNGKEDHQKKAIAGGKKFLESIGQENAKITKNECSFCHIDEAGSIVEASIKKDGYHIVKLSGC